MHLCPAPSAQGMHLLQDSLCTQDLYTTAGSSVLAGYQPSYDATSVGRLRAADMTLAGKCNLDSFAMGSTTELSDFQVRCCAVNGQILDLWACTSVCGMGPFSEAPAAASQHRPAMPLCAAIIHRAQPRLIT